MILPIPRFQGGRALMLWSGALAALGTIALIVGVIVNPTRFFFAYLAAYAAAVTTAVGALIFLMTCYAMRAKWPTAVRRLTEAVVGTMPLLAVLFIPLLFGLDRLYGPWIHPETLSDPRARAMVAHKAPYLNLPFFLIRTAIYFAIWIVCGALLRRWSLRKDSDPALDFSRRQHAFSAGMLPVVSIAVTFASFDWLMSLDPTWYSSMFPIYVFGGGFVASIALITVLAWHAQREGLLPGLSTSHYYALGRLLLAFIIFWAYAAFFQLLLIWIANEPNEIKLYLRRIENGWAAASAVLLFAHFIIPFLLLLNYQLKRRPPWLSALAVWILIAHYIDMHWIVVAAVPSGRPIYHWIDAAAAAAIGGACVLFGALRLRGERMAPVNDPALPAALSYESL